MKITHIQLSGPFTKGLTYQENLLSKHHKLLGFDVSVITNQYSYNDSGSLILIKERIEFTNDGRKIIRLPIKNNKKFKHKFKRYEGLYETLLSEKPSVVFLHGTQLCDVNKIIKYIKNNPKVKLYADNHADFTNSATNFLSRNILHKIIWKRTTKKIEKYAEKIWGVTPGRVDFLKNMYNVNSENTDLLIMGGDDEYIKKNDGLKIRESFKEELLIITGGKIDSYKKEVLNLMNAVSKLPPGKIKLVVFGSVQEELKEEFELYIDSDNIDYIGWINNKESYDYFAAADIVIFPGRHSVYWEQVVSQGTPIGVTSLVGFEHIDIGGNVKIFKGGSNKIWKEELDKLLHDKKQLKNLKESAQSIERENFFYSNIARKSIGLKD
jgi:glycosyltransferase involved in cell wall biosynthesis